MGYEIRPAKKEEMKIMVEWAAKEGWNPGLHDIDAFYEIDDKGFYLGFLDNQPISSISAVTYENKFGFLGFYIVKPEFRGLGYGLRLWKEAIKHLPNQNIGLDGVEDQQENYKKSGFKLAYGKPAIGPASGKPDKMLGRNIAGKKTGANGKNLAVQTPV